MNSRATWNWLLVAAALFAFIFFFERHWQKPEPELQPMLPQIKAADVTSILVRPAGQPEIRADRTNETWQITRPILYPAQNDVIETLLAVLEHLAPAGYIPARELRQRPKFDEEYGFTAPQVSLTVQQGENHCQILFGIRTAPGDQVFVQVVGTEGVYVADADLLKLIPHIASQWLDTAIVDLHGETFDRVLVTNGVRVIELSRDPVNGLWNMTRPIHARADSARVTDSLQRLLRLNALQFVTNTPTADLEGFGLQPAELSLTLARDTNALALVEIGKSLTNAPERVYVRRDGLASIATVSNNWLEPWLASVNDFRDHHLVNFTAPVRRIEVHGSNIFALQLEGTNQWTMVGDHFPVDAEVAAAFLKDLAAMSIVQFKDAVTETDLPEYGLTNPLQQILIQLAPESGADLTNAPLELSFGAVVDDKIYVRRADEDSVYAVPAADYQRFPVIGWQLRERRFWNFTEDQVARVTVRQKGKVRALTHVGTNAWAMGASSEGLVNGPAVEEVVHRFGELAATLWTARGDTNQEAYGFSTNQTSFEFELKTGAKLNVEFGGTAPSEYPYAAVVLDGERWVFEFPLALYHFAMSYLSIPADAP